MKDLQEMYFDSFFDLVDAGELIGVPGEGVDQVDGDPDEDGAERCPFCGSVEISSDSPRTTYGCGTSCYDQREGTWQQSSLCKHCRYSTKSTADN
jgi:hypothetical protein